MERGELELLPARSNASAYARVSSVTAPSETIAHVSPLSDRNPDYQYHHGHSTVDRKGFEETTEDFINPRPTTTDNLPWLPGVLKHVPWLGLCALCITMSCMALSIAVLVISNGQPVKSWWIQPTVFLAAASAAANITLQFALAEGITISWWYKALRGGTLGDLHRSWRFGDSVWATLTAGRHFNKIALASLIVSVAVVDGPLLQRASNIVPKDVTSSIMVHTSIAPQLPVGYTSSRLGVEAHSDVLSPQFADVLQDYSRRTPITTGFEGCVGKCETVVQAAGFAVDCQPPTRTPIEFSQPATLENGTLPDSALASHPIFSVDLGWSPGSGNPDINSQEGLNTSVPEQLFLTVGYSDTKDCAGSFVENICTLTEAIVDYQILLDNNTISLNNPTANLHVVTMGTARANIWTSYSPGKNETLGGFALAGTDLFSSNTSVRWVGYWEINMLNTFASQYIINPKYLGNCQFEWRDPTNDILNDLHEIMFRTALKAASAADSVFILTEHDNRTFVTKQSLHATQRDVQNVFVSQYSYLFGALAVMMLGVLSVIPTYYGWWRLGRPMTLSPIETAKAFNAPLLNQQPLRSNVDVDRLMRDMGDRPVRYGEVAVAVPEYSDGPHGTEMTGFGENSVAGSRLEMAHPDIVLRPRKGARFDA